MTNDLELTAWQDMTYGYGRMLESVRIAIQALGLWVVGYNDAGITTICTVNGSRQTTVTTWANMAVRLGMLTPQ